VKILILKLEQMLHILHKDGLLSPAKTCQRTNQHINNTVQQGGIDSS